MDQMIVALLAWIAGETGLAMPPVPPVELLAKEEISQHAYGRRWQSGDVQAAYDWGKGVVYLHNDWREDNPHCIAVLLHELVHHAQAFNRVRYDCAAAKERQAYELSIRWLRGYGVTDPYAVLNIDPFTIAALSLCAASE